MENIEKRDQCIRAWIKEAADNIKQQQSNKRVVEEKSGRNDLVTDMDKETERFLIQKIQETFPGERVCGEEGMGDRVEDLSGIVWFLDPIDGTLNYVLQQENFAIMLGIYENGKGMMGYIYDANDGSLYSGIKGKGLFKNGQPMPAPEDKRLSDGLIASSSLLMTDKRFTKNRDVAEKTMGVRMIGSAGLEILEVLKGNLVGYMASSLAPWDIAPGKVMLDEAGIFCTQFNGDEVDLLKKNRTLIALPSAHQEMLKIISEN